MPEMTEAVYINNKGKVAPCLANAMKMYGGVDV
jgi:hypothetical protein